MTFLKLHSSIKSIFDFQAKMLDINAGAQINPLIIKLIIIQIFKEFWLILFILILAILFNFLFQRNLKKHYNSNKFFIEEQYYTVTENKIEIKSDSSSAIITKDKINKIIYNKNAVYIFISLSVAYVITESFFADKDEFIDFKSFMDRYYKI